jgi:hypothetical protein
LEIALNQYTNLPQVCSLTFFKRKNFLNIFKFFRIKFKKLAKKIKDIIHLFKCWLACLVIGLVVKVLGLCGEVADFESNWGIFQFLNVFDFKN